NYALTQRKYPVRTMEEVRSFIGNGVEMLMRRAVPKETGEQEMLAALSVFRAYYRTHTRVKTKPYDGIMETVTLLKQRDIPMAVVSNKSHRETEALIREIFGGIFQKALGSLTDIPKKPAPNGVLRVLKEMDLSPKDTVYIGDSEVDVETAHNAGLLCLGVSWGYRGREALAAARADAIVDTPQGLLNYF
ncbi:MAG: HAD family hydrolase, partial [Bacillota bacterium]|nr:HAD family hydrolase [Bacillota bacterium]